MSDNYSAGSIQRDIWACNCKDTEQLRCLNKTERRYLVPAGRSKKNDIVLNESYVSRNHLLITAERGRIRIEDLESTYGTYLNGSPVKKAMLKSGDEIDICDLRMICKEHRKLTEDLQHPWVSKE